MSNEAMAYLVLPHEAEHIIEHLDLLTLNEMGSSKFMSIHSDVEKLNLQAHQSAKQKSDNFVIESILTFNKLPLLIQNMLANELWKEQVFPLLNDFSDAASLRTYFVLYHEAVLCNLLEVAFYHEHVLESLSDDILMEVVDYTMRKLTWLISTPREVIRAKTTFHKSGQDIVAELDKASRLEELNRQSIEMEFRIAVQCVTIMRYICERVHILSLNLLTRILDKHDVLLTLTALIENPPWTYKTEAKEWKKFQDQKWTYVDPSDLLQVTTTEAQPWIAVYFLVCSQCARDQYQLTSFRKNQVLRIRKYLNDIMLDQLPLLADVQRFLDELAIVQLNPNAVSSAAKLVMEVVPVIRTSLLREHSNEYPRLAALFLQSCTEINRQDDMKQLADVYNMSGIDELLDGVDSSKLMDELAEKNNNESSASPEEPEGVVNVPTSVELLFSNSTKRIIEVGSSDEIILQCVIDVTSEKRTETTDGIYYRYALRTETETKQVIPAHASVHATIQYDGTKNTTTLSTEDLNLPIGSQKSVWRQLGSLEEGNGIIQIQFKVEFQQYHTASMYISVPLTV